MYPYKITEIVQGFLSDGFEVLPRESHEEYWNDQTAKIPYTPVAYTQAMISYQLAYQAGHGGRWNDFSMHIQREGKPVALWLLTLSHGDLGCRVSSQGLPLHPPLFFPDVPYSWMKRTVKRCLTTLDEIGRISGIKHWISAEASPVPRAFSEWHMESMARGASCSVRHEMVVDLQPSLDDIRAGFRKRYKSLINVGEREWHKEIHGFGQCPDHVWEEFQMLHLRVSGRVTRSERSWKLQQAALLNSNAFLVVLRGELGSMVGGGLFYYTPHEGLYAVGAYNRELFEKPIGHVVQFAAISKLRELGVKYYRIGTKPVPADVPEPSAKEMSIADFKQGFASHVVPSFILKHPIGGHQKEGVFEALE